MNKLGLNSSQLELMEKELVMFKMSLLSEWFTFNLEGLDSNYLKKLHSFLFSDLYDDAGTFSSRMTLDCIRYVDKQMEELNELVPYIRYEESLQAIIDTLKTIMDVQLFNDGNKRTCISYLSILLMAHKLNDSYEIVGYDNLLNFNIVLKTPPVINK